MVLEGLGWRAPQCTLRPAPEDVLCSPHPESVEVQGPTPNAEVGSGTLSLATSYMHHHVRETIKFSHF